MSLVAEWKPEPEQPENVSVKYRALNALFGYLQEEGKISAQMSFEEFMLTTADNDLLVSFGIDSLDMTDIEIRIEDACGIKFGTDDEPKELHLDNDTTIKQLEELVVKLHKGKPEPVGTHLRR